MDDPNKPSEKIGKTVGHAVEVFVAWITQMVLQGYRKLKESQVAGEARSQSVPAGNGRAKFEQIHTNPWADFFSFKLLLFPIFIRVLYVLSLIGWAIIFFLTIVNAMRSNGNSFGIGSFLLMLFGPIILHVIFEFLMVPFSMLDVQREIRDEMKTLNQQLAELHVKQDTAQTEEKSPSEGEEK